MYYKSGVGDLFQDATIKSFFLKWCEINDFSFIDDLFSEEIVKLARAVNEEYALNNDFFYENGDIEMLSLLRAVFRKSVKDLLGKIKEHSNNIRLSKTRSFVIDGKYTMASALGIYENRKILQTLRGVVGAVEVEKKELEIAQKIQEAVSGFSMKTGMTLRDLVVSGCMDCVGASIFGGLLLKEAGVFCLQGRIPGHAIIILITSNKRVFWQDMTEPYKNGELLDSDIHRVDAGGNHIKISDIVDFSKSSLSEKSLRFNVVSKDAVDKIFLRDNKERKILTLYNLEIGQMAMLLNNMGIKFLYSGFNREAEMAFMYAIRLDPSFAYSYNGLGNAFFETGYNTINTIKSLAFFNKAIEAYKRAIETEPDCLSPYYGWGTVLFNMNHYEEALEKYDEAIEKDAEYPMAHYGKGEVFRVLGDKKTAIEEYREFIRLDKNKKYEVLVCMAKKRLADLSNNTD
jgi:hypothetical protein